jgi:hypothetical protein
MTDSCASVSVDGGHIYLESLTNCLCILLYSLAQTLILPGCEIKFLPEIDISVYVYFPLHRTPSHQVLIHGKTNLQNHFSFTFFLFIHHQDID